MPKAARRTTTKPHLEATDPMLKIASQIERIWDAEAGADSLVFEARAADDHAMETVLEGHRRQLVEWRNALELAASFTVARSMAGAAVQMAMVVSDLQSIAETIDGNKAGEMESRLVGMVEGCQRMIHSALDVMIGALGDDYALYRKIVTTYAVVGEPRLNWLNNVEDLAEKGWLEYQRDIAIAEKTEGEVAA